MLGNSFLYCWTDHKTNKLYVGKHKGSITDGYICSSKTMKKEYKLRPQDFSRQIVAEGTEEDVLKLETVILSTINASQNDDFYNLTNNKGHVWSDLAKDKASISHKGKKFTSEHKKKQSESGKKAWQKRKLKGYIIKGTPHTEESKRKLSEARLGKKYPLASEIATQRGKAFALTLEGIAHFKKMNAKRTPSKRQWTEEDKREHSKKVHIAWENGVYVNRPYNRSLEQLSNDMKSKWDNNLIDSLKWSKAIHTPYGDFPSLTLCSKQISLSYDQIRYRLKTNNDWYYISEKEKI